MENSIKIYYTTGQTKDLALVDKSKHCFIRQSMNGH